MSWNFLKDKKPPYHETVVVIVKHFDSRYPNFLQLATRMPGSLMDDLASDFWLDAFLEDDYLGDIDILMWAHVPPLLNGNVLRVVAMKETENGVSYYAYKNVWIPQDSLDKRFVLE